MRSGVPALLGKLEVDQSGDETLLGTVMQVPGNALTRSVGGGNQARPRRYQLLLGALAVGDVAHVGGEDRLSGQASARDRQLSGKFSAVGAHGRHLNPAVQDAALPGLQVAGQATPVCFSQRRRHDRIGKVYADHLLGPVAEGALECAVHVRHPGVPVNADDGVESGFENGALPGRAHGEHGARVSATSRSRSAWPRSSASETLCSRASSALRTVPHAQGPPGRSRSRRERDRRGR